MDYTTAALTYALLIIPLGFSCVIIGQGVSKIRKKDENGKIVLGLGILFLILVPAVFVMLTKV